MFPLTDLSILFLALLIIAFIFLGTFILLALLICKKYAIKNKPTISPQLPPEPNPIAAPQTQNPIIPSDNKRSWDMIPASALGFIRMLLQAIIFIGGFAYIVVYIESKGTTTSPIDIAATSGTIGGLLLIGAFTNPNDPRLKKIGKNFLATAAYSTISFLLLAWAHITNPPHLDALQETMIWVSAIIIVLGLYYLALALVDLVLILPTL